MSVEDVDELYRDYANARGGVPNVEQEPTADQLAAVRQTLRNGGPPYVDFSLFAPSPRPSDGEAAHLYRPVLQPCFRVLDAARATGPGLI